MPGRQRTRVWSATVRQICSSAGRQVRALRLKCAIPAPAQPRVFHHVGTSRAGLGICAASAQGYKSFQLDHKC
jgi:hypothetical protein